GLQRGPHDIADGHLTSENTVDGDREGQTGTAPGQRAQARPLRRPTEPAVPLLPRSRRRRLPALQVATVAHPDAPPRATIAEANRPEGDVSRAHPQRPQPRGPAGVLAIRLPRHPSGLLRPRHVPHVSRAARGRRPALLPPR